MNDKKQISISGSLLFPLRKGDRAVIIRYGGYTYTSRVVRILETKTDHVLFETMNHIYRVSLVPSPKAAALFRPLAMCA